MFGIWPRSSLSASSPKRIKLALSQLEAREVPTVAAPSDQQFGATQPPSDAAPAPSPAPVPDADTQDPLSSDGPGDDGLGNDWTAEDWATFNAWYSATLGGTGNSTGRQDTTLLNRITPGEPEAEPDTTLLQKEPEDGWGPAPRDTLLANTEPGGGTVLAEGTNRLISRLEGGAAKVYYVRTHTFWADAQPVAVGDLVNVDGAQYVRRNGQLVPLEMVMAEATRTGYPWEGSGESAAYWDQFFQDNQVDLSKPANQLTLAQVGEARLIQEAIAKYGPEARELIRLMQESGYSVERAFSGGLWETRVVGKVIQVDVHYWGATRRTQRTLPDSVDAFMAALRANRQVMQESLDARRALEAQVQGQDPQYRTDDGGRQYVEDRQEAKRWAANAMANGVFLGVATALGVAADLIPLERFGAFLLRFGNGLRLEARSGRILNASGHELTQQEVTVLLRQFAEREGIAIERGAVGGGVKVNAHHLFQGEINKSGKAVGYHHRPWGEEPITARVTQVVSPANQQGVYRARVEVWNPVTKQWVAKGPVSSFFPDSWSPWRVLEEVRAAFANRTSMQGNKWRGVSPSGIEIEGYVDAAGNINTAYPLYVP